MTSILIPVLYVVVIFGGLYIFSHFYRKRTAATRIEPYFTSHPERDTYFTLLQRTDPPTPDVLLKTALVRRAMADVNRVLRIREDKPALQNLLQKGSIGDDLWNSILAAEKELEAEILDVVQEANSYVENWGTLIFQNANEIIANEKMRSIFESTQGAKDRIRLKFDTTSESSAPPTSTLTQTPIPAKQGRRSPAPPDASVTKPRTNGAVSPQLPASTSAAAANTASASDSEVKKPSKKGKKRK